jgi:hypothetical protein
MPHPENINRLARVFYIPLTAILVLVVCTGCPYQSKHQLEDIPSLEIEKNFIGKWRGNIKHEVTGEETSVKLEIDQHSSNEYQLDFIGYFLKRKDKKKRLILDTVSATGFMSMIESKMIMNIKYHDQVYLADFYYANDQISLLPMSDHFTSFMIRSNQQLKNVVAYHFKSRLKPLYDESFCLRNMSRIPE